MFFVDGGFGAPDFNEIVDQVKNALAVDVVNKRGKLWAEKLMTAILSLRPFRHRVNTHFQKK